MSQPTYADAIDHLDHVGIGSDFDGGGGLIGINDVSEMPNITQELLARGYTKSDSESALLLIKLKSFCPLPSAFCLTQLLNIISQQDLVLLGRGNPSTLG